MSTHDTPPATDIRVLGLGLVTDLTISRLVRCVVVP
jgi:hypothetical protein